VREALLENDILPDAHESSAVGIACATCHEPHAEQANVNVLNGVYSFTNLLSGLSIVISNTTLGAIYSNQLRNPLASTNNYSMSDGPFASQYDPNVNLCAQCHNDRGASWTNSNFPPHNSLQYNMLLGTVGVLTNGTLPNLPATHSQLEKQCVSCHMQTSPYQSQAQPGTAGHGFKVQLYDTCTPCHGAGQGQGLVGLLNFIVSTKVSQVKSDLDNWAITKAPAALTNYGTRAWEYVNPGGLSSGGPGPASALQTNIPVNIQKARFDLYSVYNDGSSGVHNPFYVLYLLDNADWWVRGELNKPKP
jgi:cytochrome c553